MDNWRAGLTRTAASVVLALVSLGSAVILAGCGAKAADPNTVTVAIESSPTNLDPRIGVDAQSERIDELIFDSLVKKDAHFNLQPDLATSWDTPNPLTYIFHLRTGVKFQNGQPFTARDVKWTLDSMRDHTILTAKYQAYRNVASIDAPDPQTIIIHMKQPDSALLWSLSDGALGIVPYGSGRDFQQHPIGTGPFRFVSQELDKEVVLERNPLSWQTVPKIARLRFEVIPDEMTRALALRKGSADIASNALSPDMIWSMRNDKSVAVAEAPGTVVQYLTFNLRDPYLRDPRVRQAIAYAMNRPLIIDDAAARVWRTLPTVCCRRIIGPTPDDVAHYDYNPQQRETPCSTMPDMKPGSDGIRFHLTMKTSNDGGARVLAMALQQQLRAVGIALDVRSFEFATFYSDISHGSFGMYSLRWIGGNEDPGYFHYAFASASFRRMEPIAGIIPTRKSTSWLQAAASESDQAKRAVRMFRCSKFWRKKCRPCRSGISIPS